MLKNKYMLNLVSSNFNTWSPIEGRCRADRSARPALELLTLSTCETKIPQKDLKTRLFIDLMSHWPHVCTSRGIIIVWRYHRGNLRLEQKVLDHSKICGHTFVFKEVLEVEKIMLTREGRIL